MIDLDSLVRAEAGTFALETVRIAGVVIAAPLAWLSAPVRVRSALVLMLAFAAHAENGVSLTPRPFEQMAFSVGSEFMLGLGIGFVVRLFVAVAEMAADHIAPMMGIGAAQLFDPQTKNMQNVMATMLRNFAVLLGLIAGVHRVLIGGVMASFKIVPVGTLSNPALETPVILAMTTEALASGVRIAIPFIAILFMAQIALGVHLARGASDADFLDWLRGHVGHGRLDHGLGAARHGRRAAGRSVAQRAARSKLYSSPCKAR